MPEPDKTPGADQPVSQDEKDNQTVIQFILRCKQEAEDAKRSRTKLNEINQETFLGNQDFSHKTPGQSMEFLPKIPLAVEQFANFFKRAVTAYGQWFELELPKPNTIDDLDCSKLLQCFLDGMYRIEEGQYADFATLLGDGVKTGLVKSLVIFKVHGRKVSAPKFSVERGQEFIEEALPSGAMGRVPVPTTSLKRNDRDVWRLMIDLIAPEDYFPDPSGKKLYEIHQIERDLWEIEHMVEKGIYDKAEFEKLKTSLGSQQVEDKEKRDHLKNQDSPPPPVFRKPIVLLEFWGTFLKDDGSIAQKNKLATIANGQFLLRKPEDWPYWHGQSCFVAAPLLRVPGSVWHKAILDHAAPLNILQNELFNLMVDGGLASVWGVRQVHKEWMEDPGQASEGISQGETIAVNEQCPKDGKVVEQVSTGKVPVESIQMFNIVDKLTDQSMMLSDIRMGLLPPTDTKATAVLEASQNSSAFFDGLLRDFERTCLEPTLWKAWLTVLQNMNDLESGAVINTMGYEGMLELAVMTPEERFHKLGYGCAVKVHGLSAILARVREFQKTLALLQSVSQNPVLLQAFFTKYNPDKILEHMFKTLNLDPDNFKLAKGDTGEKLEARVRSLPLFMALASAGGKGAALNAGGTGEPVASETNQIGKNAQASLGGGVT